MNRKQFIQSQGATCKNWNWSFISHDCHIVIFGAWDTEREQGCAVILREKWDFSAKKKGSLGIRRLSSISAT